MEKRNKLFNKAFSHISEQIEPIYSNLTKSDEFPAGGRAYLTADEEEPYLAGVNYHTMPPTKRFRDMEHLSGGEKTMAALALLFAIHSYQPSPFFVLDEVDAALDNANVGKLVNYVRNHAVSYRSHHSSLLSLTNFFLCRVLECNSSSSVSRQVSSRAVRLLSAYTETRVRIAPRS
jgi:chromosome segregation ATPase